MPQRAALAKSRDAARAAVSDAYRADPDKLPASPMHVRSR
jgi:hypothetical protein